MRSETKKFTISHEKKVENEIQRLFEQEFIDLVTSSPKWVSPLVSVRKNNGNVRLFVDMQKANAAVNRNYDPTPTLDEILYNVNSARIFSKLDLV